MANTDTSQAGTSTLDNIIGDLGNAAAPGAMAAYFGSNVNGLTNTAINNLLQFAQQIQGSIKAPDLLNYINQQIMLAKQGTISPATALSAVQQKSNMYGVQVPQQFTDAVNSALAQEQQIAKQGYTPVERAGIQSAFANVAQQQAGNESRIAAAQQARGQYGGGQALTQEQQALQGEINNASTQTNQIEANAYNRALTALQNSGQLGLTAGQQSFSQNAAVAQAQDAINQFNTNLTQQANAANAQYQQQATLQEAQQQQARDIANQSTALNLNQQEVNAAQQNYGNELALANTVGSYVTNAAGNAGKLASYYIPGLNSSLATTANTLLGSGSGLTSAITGGLSSLFNGLGSGSGNVPWMGSTGTAPGGNTADTTGAGISNDANTASSAYPQPSYYDFYNGGGTTTTNPLTDYTSGSDTGSNWTFGGSGDTTGTGDTSGTGFAHGGALERALRAYGGGVSGPGTTTSDSIPVKLSNHEYVINAKSTAKYKPLVEAINQDNEGGILDALSKVSGGSRNKPQMVVESDEEGPRPAKPSEQKALSDVLKALSKLGA